MPGPGDAIGTAHPIELIASARNGRWIVACQARVDTDHEDGVHVGYGWNELRPGDALTAYLMRGVGAGVAIDALVARSADDRWLAVVRGGALWLVDDRTGRELALPGADLSPQERGWPRAAVFDPASAHVIYFRALGPRRQVVVVRALATGEERALAVPPGLVWRVSPEPEGPWARLELVEADRDGDGLLRGVNLDAESAVGHTCKGRLGDELPMPDADAVRTAWLDLSTGAIETDPGLLGHVAGAAIVRTPDRAIRIGDVELVPAACRADVLAVSARPLRVVVTCGADATTAPVELFGPRFHVTVAGVTQWHDGGVPPTDPIDAMAWRERAPGVVETAALCLDERPCFALADGAVLLRAPAHGIAAGNAVVAVDLDGARVTDVITHRTLDLPDNAPNRGIQAGTMMAFGTDIVDLAQPRVIGEVMRPPLAVDAAGRALLPAGGCVHELCAGPLRWVTPRPRGAPAPPSSGTIGHRAGEPPPLAGIAVDAAGAPVADATVISDGVTWPSDPPTWRASEARWRFATTTAGGQPSPTAETSLYRHQVPTDRAGRFTGGRGGPHAAIMVVAPDGRVGLLDDVPPEQTMVRLALAAPGALHLVCHARELDRVVLRRGGFEAIAACGDTVRGLPAGRYQIVASLEAAFAITTVELGSGTTRDAVLELPRHATLHGRVVEYPGDRPLAGVSCRVSGDAAGMWIEVGGSVVTRADGSFDAAVQDGHLQVRCTHPFARLTSGSAEVEVTGGEGHVVVRRVRFPPTGAWVGALGSAEPGGLRLTYASARAARAGLRAGDLIRDVDGVALAGLDGLAMSVLALEPPPEAEVRWTVERGGRTLTVRAPPW